MSMSACISLRAGKAAEAAKLKAEAKAAEDLEWEEALELAAQRQRDAEARAAPPRPASACIAPRLCRRVHVCMFAGAGAPKRVRVHHACA